MKQDWNERHDTYRNTEEKENFNDVMFGIVIATFGAPVITGVVTGKGYGMQAVFAIGAAFAALALICMVLLGRELNQSKHKRVIVNSYKEEKKNGFGNNEKTVRAGT